MKRKNVLAAVAVLAVSSGLLTISALTVPYFVGSMMANAAPKATESSTKGDEPPVLLASQKTPVLKVEGKSPVSTIEEDLQRTMTEAEIQQIYQYADSKKEGEPASRTMNAGELKRLKILEERYKYGEARPQKPLPLKAGVSSFYLDIAKDYFVYPARELTDEELLQYIDWYARVNFALSKRIVKPQPDAKDIGKEEALSKAADSIKRLFDADVSRMEATAAYNKLGPEQQGKWFLHFQPYRVGTLNANEEAYLMYAVFIDSVSGTVEDTTVVNPSYKRTPITPEMNVKIRQDPSWIEAAKSIVTKKQGDGQAIQKSSLVQDSVYDKRGVVAVALEMKDGSSYTVELRYPEKALRCLIYNPAKGSS
ncbi:hypothetical protein [Paenibacillus sp. XY044]|uniref:hypothetical protein n=1 Tax=Paenibacillus sp. XY044 TaxID=2026089 RepID=UPI000B9867ED|nr:hypothetical protein [Paenibacillus sp. XY044]OZB90031.1 hypothetical protein CJP46_35640 [Paenibacillus sp. XY044]